MDFIRRLIGLDDLHKELNELRSGNISLDKIIADMREELDTVRDNNTAFGDQIGHKMQTWNETFDSIGDDAVKQNRISKREILTFVDALGTLTQDLKLAAFELNDSREKNNKVLSTLYSYFDYQRYQHEHRAHRHHSHHELVEAEIENNNVKSQAQEGVKSERKKVRSSSKKKLEVDIPNEHQDLPPVNVNAPKVSFEATSSDQTDKANVSDAEVDTSRFTLQNVASDKSISFTIPKRFVELGAVLVSDTSEIVNGVTNSRIRVIDFRMRPNEKINFAVQCGLRVGDVIGGVNGSTASTADELVSMMTEAFIPEKTVTLYLPHRGQVNSGRITRSTSSDRQGRALQKTSSFRGNK